MNESKKGMTAWTAAGGVETGHEQQQQELKQG